MAFSKKTKTEVKELAAFRCCRCQKVGIEIHHIIPQEYDGSDDIENAAPLCPTCHSDFGDNPKKRKMITQHRDWWYKQVERQYPDNRIHESQLASIDSKLKEIRDGKKKMVEELKIELSAINQSNIDNLTAQNAGATASTIMNSSLTSSTKIGDKVHTNMVCKNCGTSIGLLIGSNSCPTCKSPIN